MSLSSDRWPHLRHRITEVTGSHPLIQNTTRPALAGRKIEWERGVEWGMARNEMGSGWIGVDEERVWERVGCELGTIMGKGSVWVKRGILIKEIMWLRENYEWENCE